MTEKFILERRYLKAVSPKTEAWYRDSFKAFAGALENDEAIKARIVELRQRNVKPVSINTWLRCIKAFYLWQGKPWALSRLKEEQKVLSTFSPAQVQKLIRARPSEASRSRIWLASMLILDSGLRINETLSLHRDDIDFDNMLIRVRGKGNKQRLVPMSLELRKLLYRHVARSKAELVFGTNTGTPLSVRNAERDFRLLCQGVGIAGVRCSPHTLRHTFAVNYLRAGGNLFYLSKILGHTSVKTTERYLQSLDASDFQKVHNGLTLLRS